MAELAYAMTQEEFESRLQLFRSIQVNDIKREEATSSPHVNYLQDNEDDYCRVFY